MEMKLLRLRVCYLSGKKTALLSAVILLLILSTAAAGSESKKEQPVFSYGVAGRIIVIDAGHGGLDQGATRGEYSEHDITLAIAKKLEKYLSQGGAAVIMLRYNESDLAGDEFTGTIRQHKKADMKQRITTANQAGAELYISIHVNAVPGSTWSGAQVFFKPRDEKSKNTARLIQEELSRVLGNTNRKAAAGDYYVLKNVDMPAVLIETGFLSNPREAALLADPEYQRKLAYAVFSGIAKAALKDNEAQAVDQEKSL
ncbi:MAG TPA: N-acetylmuramoyl-L-alanine amidase [Syntrophomonadaceae bacterium]|nr:N-acetylmuramoyl-L-alanine amidase [Syntrophomonadaceae bacterium]HPR94133.1 N-acetylmuramoyl-L-alanine amidase [Syntrophomonadaceae bacterium]